MWRARKAIDLQREPRLAIHSGSDGPSRVEPRREAGRAVEVVEGETVAAVIGPTAPPSPSHLFRVDLRETSTVRFAPDGAGLVITMWSPAAGVRTVTRRAHRPSACQHAGAAVRAGLDPASYVPGSCKTTVD